MSQHSEIAAGQQSNELSVVAKPRRAAVLGGIILCRFVSNSIAVMLFSTCNTLTQKKH